MYSQESALLRSHFLTTSPEHASLIILPSVELCLLPNDIDKNDLDLSFADESLLAVSSDTCSLIPNAIAIIDTGDNIVVRLGRVILNEINKDYLLKKMIDIATKRAFGRYPYPKLIILDRPWTANDRLVFSRLSPSHRDSKDFRLLTASLKPMVSSSTLDELVTYLPHTDQLTYFMYIWECIPRYARIYEKYHRTISAPENNTMNRDTTSYVSANVTKTSYKRRSLLQWVTGMKSSNDAQDDSDDEIILSMP